MASESQSPITAGKRPADDPEPSLQYKHRGVYETSRLTPARLFFVLMRLLTLSLIYSMLVSATSPFSFFSKFPSLAPTKLPPATSSIMAFPGININGMLSRLSKYLDMDPNAVMVFAFFLLESFQFTIYNLFWRREVLPLTGDGGSIPVSLAVTIIDIVHITLYTHISRYNPTWTASLFRWTPTFFIPGLLIQFLADQQKHSFKQNPQNEKKVLMTGLWSVVRNPNYTGFIVWKTALAMACGGWVLAGLLAWMHTQQTVAASIPSIEMHVKKRYGEQWDEMKKRVRWRMVPGIY